MQWSKTLGTPFIVTGHGYDIYHLLSRNDAWRATLIRVLERADTVTTVSEFNRALLVKAGVSPERVEVIPNGFDPALFYPRDRLEVRKSLGLESRSRVVLYVGNLVRSKGVDRLIAAIARLPLLNGSPQLVIIGGGPEHSRLKRLATKSRIHHRVLFLGEQSHSSVANWMRASDLLCLPSQMEGLPTVAVEALACGIPVVASRVGGTPTLLSNDSGILVEPGDQPGLERALTEGLDREWDSICISDTVGKFARERVREQWRSVYARALTGKKAPEGQSRSTESLGRVRRPTGP